MSIEKITNLFNQSIETKKKLVAGNDLNVLNEMSFVIANSIKDGNKLLLCGNGGSAADAQHLAAEMLIRLRPKFNREGIPALALAQDTSTITACGNDYGYEYLYERMLSTLGSSNDVFIALSTSGNSENIIRAMKTAKKMNIKVFGFLGNEGGLAKQYCDLSFTVPSKNTGRIQESHITAGHALMEVVEDRLIEDGFIHFTEDK